MTGRPPLELLGLGRGRPDLAAVLALNGARVAALKRARVLSAALAARSLLVAVDGGLQTCREARVKPDLFVGDGDSVSRVPPGLARVTYDEDKDHSDLAGALDVILRRGARLAVLAGALGGRLDHEWGNLLELQAHAPQFAGLLATDARSRVLITSQGCRLVTRPSRTISLFAFGPGATVSLSGTRWDLARHRLRPGSHGLSNVTGDELELVVHRGTAVLTGPGLPF